MLLRALAPQAEASAARGASMCRRLFASSAPAREGAAGGGDGPPPPPPAAGGGGAQADQPDQMSEEERAASLPVVQLAKALLAGNMRGQLTTITAGEPGADASKVSSSVTAYLSPRGEAPVVLLSPQSDSGHLANIREAAKASLATGHISPPWFIQRLRGTGWLPRRVALLGTLEPLPAGELKYAWEQARKASSAAPGLAALLPEEAALPGLVGYRLQGISQVVHVDPAGRQHPVSPEELDSCFLDPLALAQHDILAEVNQSPDWQAQLRLFAAAFLGVHAGEVLLAEADRLGFTLLGSPTGAASSSGTGAASASSGGQQQAAEQAAAAAGARWRQYRIGSARELRSRRHFMELLEQMKAEVSAAAGAA